MAGAVYAARPAFLEQYLDRADTPASVRGSASPLKTRQEVGGDDRAVVAVRLAANQDCGLDGGLLGRPGRALTVGRVGLTGRGGAEPMGTARVDESSGEYLAA